MASAGSSLCGYSRRETDPGSNGAVGRTDGDSTGRDSASDARDEPVGMARSYESHPGRFPDGARAIGPKRAVAGQAGTAARKKSRRASPIWARRSALDGITSVMVKDVWIWPRPSSCTTRTPAAASAFGVCPALVAQRIELGGDDQGRRKVRQISPQRRCLLVDAVSRVGVVIPEPLHEWRRQDVAEPILLIGRCAHAAVRDRRQEQLADDVRSAGISRQLAGHRRDVGTRTPSGHREVTRQPTELHGVGGDPLHGSKPVIRRRREAGLRRVPVVDRHDHRMRAEAQVSAEWIVGVQAAEHHSATVEVGHQRMRTFTGRPVEPVGQRPCGTREHAIDDLAHFPAGGPHGLHGLHESPGVLDRQRLHGR